MDFQKPTSRDLQEAKAARKAYLSHYVGVNDVDEDDDVKNASKNQSSDVKIPWGSPYHPDEREGKRNRPGFADRH